MSMDFNDAAPQQSGTFEPIPTGTVAPVRIHIKGMKNSPTGAKGLEIEYTVTMGPYAKRKVFNNFMGVAGNGSDGHNKMVDITRSFIRGVLESAYGVNPSDASAEARAARTLSDWEDIDGLEFLARFRVEEGDDYTDKTTGELKKGKPRNVVQAVTPDDPDYNGFKPAKPKVKGAAASKPGNGAPAGGSRPAWA